MKAHPFLFTTTLLVALLLGGAVATAAPSPQVGVGLNVGYPVGFVAFYTDVYGEMDRQPIFLGATLKWRPSILIIDSGVSFWGYSGTSLMYGYLDLGLSLDLWVFRFGLCGGFDLVNASESGSTGTYSYAATGFNARLSLDVKLGRITVGASLAAPIDVLMKVFVDQTGIETFADELRLFAGHASLNIVYWF